jgi:ElaB/YqjD/DUF883 family membrane-anchored ribosome-binding protein
MGEDPGAGRAAVTVPREPEQIQREIEQTRDQLGETVAALARKTDVKAQARSKLEDTRARVAENPLPFVAVGAVAAVLLVWRLARG